MPHSDPNLNIAQPFWFRQTLADLKRHEGFRPYAYPDPLSKLGQKYRSPKYKWGYERGDHLLVKYGESEADGRPWTVGYGFTRGVNPASSISESLASQKLAFELIEHLPVLDKLFINWRGLPPVVITVIANMAFNLGTRLLQFRPTMNEIEKGNHTVAANRLKNTLWYRQVGSRAWELVDRLKTGKVAPEHTIADFSGVTVTVSTTAQKGES